MDDQEQREPEELLEQLDVLRHLDARDVAAEAIRAGDERADRDEESHAAMRRRMWLGLRLALIITLGVVLIVAAWFRWIAPPVPVEVPVEITQPNPDTTPPVVTTPTTSQPDPQVAELVQAQVGQAYRWRLEAGASHLGTPVFGDNGWLYIAGRPKEGWTSSLHAVKPDGELMWSWQPVDQGGLQGVYCGLKGKVFVVESSHNPVVRVLDRNGREDWVKRLEGKCLGSVLSADKRTLYVSRNVSGRQSAEDGEPKYTPVNQSYITALGENGDTRWEYAADGEYSNAYMRGADQQLVRGLCLGENGAIYCCGKSPGYGGVQMLRAVNPDGTLKWRYEREKGDPVFSGVAISPQGLVYALTSRWTQDIGALVAFDDAGRVKWAVEVGTDKAKLPVFAADGTIYLCCNPKETSYDDHQLCALNPRDGSRRWSIPGKGTALTVGPDGTVYYVLRQGLCAIRPDGMVQWKSAWTAEPQFGQDGKLYLGAAVLSADGRELYQLPRLGAGSGRYYALGPDGAVYLLTDAGEIFALNE